MVSFKAKEEFMENSNLSPCKNIIFTKRDQKAFKIIL
jgi:hypothetical protein